MKVGFIGLGAMGLPMARPIVEAGHDLTVASRGFGREDFSAMAKVIRTLAAR